MRLYPNVKINLGLNILRKRPDGFHDLETLFVPSDQFHDTLDIEPADALKVDIPGIDWDPSRDLTVRAYELLRQEFDLPPVSIRLLKGSPVGAGLGGGSADAAFTLAALNDIFALGLQGDALARRAAALGSDCAFFVYNCPMFGSGRGDVLEPFDIDLSPYEIRIRIPEGDGVSTREAYGGITPGIPERSLREVLRTPVEDWKDSLVNDFEASIFPRRPRIAALKEQMYADGAVYASMSGSGSSVFGIFRK